MNKVILVGRLARDPEIRVNGEHKVCRYTLAVDRRFKRDGEPTADFINCVIFGKSAEFAKKYFSKGMRVSVAGHIQTGSYQNKDGNTVYTTDVIVEEQEFAQGKNENGGGQTSAPTGDSGDGFMNIPDGVDEELPFN